MISFQLLLEWGVLIFRDQQCLRRRWGKWAKLLVQTCRKKAAFSSRRQTQNRSPEECPGTFTICVTGPGPDTYSNHYHGEWISFQVKIKRFSLSYFLPIGAEVACKMISNTFPCTEQAISTAMGEEPRTLSNVLACAVFTALPMACPKSSWWCYYYLGVDLPTHSAIIFNRSFLISMRINITSDEISALIRSFIAYHWFGDTKRRKSS